MTRMVIGFLAAVMVGLVCAPVAAAREDMTIWGHGVRQPIYHGETTQLKFVVKNNGPDGASGVWVQADVPSGLRILGTKLYGGRSCSVSGTFVKCELGDLANQQNATVLVGVRGVRVGTWITEADVYSTDGKDTSEGNGQVRATIMVQARRRGGSSGSSAPAPTPAAAAPATGLRARFEKLQHVLRTGGIRVTLRLPRAGRLLVGAKVRVPGGFVHLSTVSRAHATRGRAWPIWLGATREEQAVLRRALKAHDRLPARVWVRYGGQTTRYALRVTR